MTDAEIYYDGRLDDILLEDYRRSRKAFLEGDRLRADQLYAANRRHHCIDLYYEVELPKHVVFVHPLGTVLGRATYGDYLAVYQNVGVGSDLDGNRPVIGSGVVLYPGAKVLGKAIIGDNVFVTANTVIENCIIPSNSVVFPIGVIPTDAEFVLAKESTCGWKHTKRSVISHYWPKAGG